MPAARRPAPGAPCPFCEVLDGTRPGHVVSAGPVVAALLDHRPLFPGHTLVVPRAHVATLAELDDPTAAALWAAGRRLAAAMRGALGAGGAFVALNDEVSQSVAHVHLHVVPRRRGDGLRGFFWPRTRYATDDEAAAVAAALRRALGEVNPPRPAPPGTGAPSAAARSGRGGRRCS